MAIKIILLFLILVIIWRVLDRFSRKQIRRGELLIWLLFWLLVGGLVIWPDASQYIADLVGIGRGVDLVVYLALLLIFYLLFRIFVRLEKQEQDMAKVVRQIALAEAENQESPNQGTSGTGQARVKSQE